MRGRAVAWTAAPPACWSSRAPRSPATLRRALAARAIEKRYLAIVAGTAEDTRIDTPLAHDTSDRRRMTAARPDHRSWPAETEVRVVTAGRDRSLVAVTMRTGVATRSASTWRRRATRCQRPPLRRPQSRRAPRGPPRPPRLRHHPPAPNNRNDGNGGELPTRRPGGAEDRLTSGSSAAPGFAWCGTTYSGGSGHVEKHAARSRGPVLRIRPRRDMFAMRIRRRGFILPPRGSFAVAQALQRLFMLFGSSTRPSSTLWQTFRQEAQMK